MQNIFIDDYKELINKLESLKSQGYVFRGQRDALNWKLEPKAFRKGTLNEYIKKSHDEKYLVVCNLSYFAALFNCEELKTFVSSWLHKKMSYSTFPLTVKRLFEIGEFLVKYNCFLSLYLKNLRKFELDDETKRILSIHSGDDWLTKEKFIGFIQYALPQIITLSGLDGSIIKTANLDNLITGYDQTYPQHYDFPTAALDFTHNYLVAIHFALSINIPSHVSKCFSLYAYKDKSSSKNTPLFLMKDKSNLQNNKRATAQQGTFVFFNRPLDFYLENGRFPTIEDYQSDLSFEIIKINAPFAGSLNERLSALLITEKINAKTLCLESTSETEAVE
jgi:hypothetical protein